MVHSLKRPLSLSVRDAAYQAAPFPVLAQLRAFGDVVPIRLPIIGRAWMTTTHAASEAMIKDNARFVQDGKTAGLPGLDRLLWWLPRTFKVLMENMLMKDEPDHRRLRKLVDTAFARRGVLDMRPKIETLADRLLDELESQPRADIIPAYAQRLPLDVIAELLGLPTEDHAQFTRWTRAVGQLDGALAVLRMTRNLSRFVAYMREQIEICRQTRRPGLVTDLIEAEEDGDRLSEDELVAMVVTLLVAGFETTTHLIAGSVYSLETHPEQKAVLLADPDARMERAVEEVLRYWSPVTSTKQRFVATDTELCGQPLKRGDLMVASLASANADPAVFDAPDTLRLDRFPNPHLAFSSGIHFCLGLQLARLEAQVAITRLYARFPDLTLGPPASRTWLTRYGLHGFRRLDVNLH